MENTCASGYGAGANGEFERNQPEEQGDAPFCIDEGYAVFTRELSRMTWPRKFRAPALDTYSGTVNPKDFLLTYTLGMHAIGADDKVRANRFPMVLKGSTRTWLLNLPAGSITSWADLRE